MTDGWSTEVVTDLPGLQRLSGGWARLYDATPTATPFQAHAWLTSWWAHYGATGALRVVLVRRHGELVAAAPLHVQRVAGVQTLTALGGNISDVSNILVHGSDALRQLVAAMLELPGWAMVDLPEVRPGTAAHALLRQWPGAVHRVPSSATLEFPAQMIEQLVSGLDRSAAKSYRRRLRRATALDLEIRSVPPEEAGDALRRLLNLHARQWAGRRMTLEHGRSRFADHLGSAVPPMIRADQAVVLEYRLDGQLLIGSLHLLGHEFVGGYLDGVAPEARSLLDISAVTLREELRLTLDRGRPIYSMLRGEEAYKYRLNPRLVRNERLMLIHPGSVRGDLLARAAGRRARTIRLAKRRAPWLRDVRDRITAVTRR